jgi:Nuclease A inhibitor-like protein
MKEKKISEEKKIDKLEINEIFIDKISQICEGLMYLSETDAEFTAFNCNKVENTSKETFLSQINGSPNVAFEEQSFDEFFLRLTTVKDWFGSAEKLQAKRFGELQEFLKLNLKDLKVFRIGKIQIDIYIVGIDAENNLIGLKTNAVET